MNLCDQCCHHKDHHKQRTITLVKRRSNKKPAKRIKSERQRQHKQSGRRRTIGLNQDRDFKFTRCEDQDALLNFDEERRCGDETCALINIAFGDYICWCCYNRDRDADGSAKAKNRSWDEEMSMLHPSWFEKQRFTVEEIISDSKLTISLLKGHENTIIAEIWSYLEQPHRVSPDSTSLQIIQEFHNLGGVFDIGVFDGIHSPPTVQTLVDAIEQTIPTTSIRKHELKDLHDSGGVLHTTRQTFNDSFARGFFHPPYGLLEPVDGEASRLFDDINTTIIFPDNAGTDCEILDWATNHKCLFKVSPYFHRGLEWWGVYLYTVYAPKSNRLTVIMASTSD